MRNWFLALLCTAPILVQAQLPAGSNHVDFKFGSTMIHAFTYKAPNYNDGCLIIAFHGDNRHPERTRDACIPLANVVGALVVAPEFDQQRFGSREYQAGNVMGPKGMNDPNQWTYTFIQEMIGQIRSFENAPNLPVYLMGHSAGGQFVGRMAAVMEMDVVRYVAANPGAWAFPTIESKWDYGLGGLDAKYQSDEWLKHYLAQPLTVYLGQADIGDNDLDESSGANNEGVTRLERGRRFFNYGKDLAASRALIFNWRLVEVPGIGHDQFGMYRSPSVLNALFGEKGRP